MPGAGLEPVSDFSGHPLKMVCLPVPPPRHIFRREILTLFSSNRINLRCA